MISAKEPIEMKRMLNWTFSLLLLCTMFSSCSLGDHSKRGISSIEPEKIRLRFISSWGGVDSKAEAIREIFKRFQSENPDIEIINESLFGEDFLPKIKTDFASGNSPDVFGLWPGSDIRALVKAGKVADLTDLLDADTEWKNSFNNKMWSYTTYDGRVYGLPVETIFECLFINKDLFSAYSVKIPETYDELKQAVISFKDQHVIPIAFNTEAEGTYFYQNLVCALAGKSIIEQPSEKGEYRDFYLKAMDYMKELYIMGAFPPNSFTLSNNERNILFRDKKAAMIVQGSWFIGNLKDSQDTVEIIPFPHMDEEKARGNVMIYGLGCGNFHISRSAFESKKKDASIKLIRTLTSKQSASYLAEQTGMLSSVIIDDSDIKYNRLTRRGLKLLDSSAELIGPPDSFIDRTAWEDCIVKNLPYILEGKKLPVAVWDEAVLKGIIEK